jgi:hypothetical protein
LNLIEDCRLLECVAVVALVRTDVSEERITTIIRVKIISDRERTVSLFFSVSVPSYS